MELVRGEIKVFFSQIDGIKIITVTNFPINIIVILYVAVLQSICCFYNKLVRVSLQTKYFLQTKPYPCHEVQTVKCVNAKVNTLSLFWRTIPTITLLNWQILLKTIFLKCLLKQKLNQNQKLTLYRRRIQGKSGKIVLKFQTYQRKYK